MVDCATPWTVARQAPLSSTISWSLLKFMSIESVMLSNHLILCHLLLLLPPIFSSNIQYIYNKMSPVKEVGRRKGSEEKKQKRKSIFRIPFPQEAVLIHPSMTHSHTTRPLCHSALHVSWPHSSWREFGDEDVYTDIAPCEKPSRHVQCTVTQG